MLGMTRGTSKPATQGRNSGVQNQPLVFYLITSNNLSCQGPFFVHLGFLFENTGKTQRIDKRHPSPLNLSINIAILTGGSLTKLPCDSLIAGEWQPDGPKPWIEFSRISREGKRAGCLTLVVDDRCGAEISTFYVSSQRSNPSQAIADMQDCE
jgi:hypothetical protein